MVTAQSSLSHDRPLKPVHMSLAGCSDCLFALRGLGLLMGAQWPLDRLARRVSELIDSLLLLAGISLWFALSLSPEAKPFRSTLIGIVKPLAALDRRLVSVAARGRAAPGA